MKKILRLIIFFSLTFALLSCKKHSDIEDTTLYHWKRKLVSDIALNPLDNDNSKIYVVATEYVYLTNAQMEEQKKSKRKDGTIFFYRFTKAGS